MANNTKTIIPRDIIPNLSITQSGISYSKFIDNKPKLILQSYGLYDNFVGSIIEQWPVTYTGPHPRSVDFSHGELYNRPNQCFSEYYDEYTGHILPVINICFSDFTKLIRESEQFEVFSNAYGIPSMMFGTYSNGKPIIMPILNWNNLPKDINPFQKEDEILTSTVQLGMPPQIYHKIIKEGNGSCSFSPDTLIDEKVDIYKLLEDIFNNSKFFDKPIEYTPRQYPLTASELLIKASKVDQNYQAYKLREEHDKKIMKLIEELSNVDKSLAEKINNYSFAQSLHFKEHEAQERFERQKASERAEIESRDEFYKKHFGINSYNGPLDLSEEGSITHTDPGKHFLYDLRLYHG